MDLPKIKAVLFTSKTYKDGTHPIMIRITQNRKHLYRAVGYSVLSEAWDDDTQFVYEKKPQITKRQEGQLNADKLLELKVRYKDAIVLHNARHINTAIKDKIDELLGISEKLKVNDEQVDLKAIKSKLFPQELGDRTKSFSIFANEFRDRFLKAGSIGTYRGYKAMLNKLQEYRKEKDLTFADVTVEFLSDYHSHLQSLGNKVNTIHKNLKSIRAIYYAAIAERIITAEHNPFFIYKLKADNNVKKEKLNVAEILSLEALEYEKDSLKWHVKNFFLFSFYCAGIRASDVLQLKWNNISDNGRLEYRMDKTGHHKSIALMPKANFIINCYKAGKAKQADYIFPFIDTSLNLTDSIILFNQVSSNTVLVNKYLKEIAKDAKITKPLSTHIARHSFSDIARRKKASIYDISKMLGHSSIKVTEAYLASFDIDSQDEAMKSILDY